MCDFCTALRCPGISIEGGGSSGLEFCKIPINEDAILKISIFSISRVSIEYSRKSQKHVSSMKQTVENVPASEQESSAKDAA